MRRTRARQCGTKYSSFEAFIEACLRDVGLNVDACSSCFFVLHENGVPDIPVDRRNFMFVERGDTILIGAVPAAAPASPAFVGSCGTSGVDHLSGTIHGDGNAVVRWH